MKLFNKGIYKSTLRRFCWGSVFYFVILFMITGMPILMGKRANIEATSEVRHILLCYGTYILPSVIIAIIASAVTAMLIYRFAHSKKQAIFTHGLPVTREENFISTALAGLTLMAAPVVLNTLILTVMTFTGYGYLFTAGECMIWMGVNLLCIFVMFAYSTFAAMLTGNSFAVAVLNFLLHVFLVLIALGFSSIAMAFLYGYADTNTVLNFFAENNPVVWIVEVTDNVCDTPSFVDASKVILHSLAAVILYALSLVLYKKRKMETAEDVAAFAVLNPIFKYLLTFILSLAAFGFCMSIGKNLPTIIMASLIVSALVYFGSEMALKKTLKVWRAYKGYLGFLAVYALILAITAFTSLFGYETRIPDLSDIDKVAVYQYYYRGEEPFVDNEEIEKYALALHREILEGEDAKEKWCAGDTRQTNIHIKYKLRNGRTIHRRYGIDNNKKREIMNELYKHEDYKIANEGIFSEEIKDIRSIRINHSSSSYTGDVNELLECVRKDVLELDYNQMHMDYIEHWSFSLAFDYLIKSEEKEITTASQPYNPDAGILNNVYMSINANYKNTIDWLKRNGYWDKVATLEQYGVWYICEDEFERKNAEGGGLIKTDLAPMDRFKYFYRISGGENLAKAAELIYNYEICEIDDMKYYTMVYVDESGQLGHGFSVLTSIDEFTAKALMNETNAEAVMQ